MELLKHNEEWFLSDEGVKAFNALSSLEERMIFFLSYLKKCANPILDKDMFLEKMAFFLADGVCGAGQPYSAYPNIVDPDGNPFICFLKKAKMSYDNKKMYIILSAILQKQVDPGKADEWIYSSSFMNADDFYNQLEEIGCQYLPSDDIVTINPAVYQMDEELKPLQIELVWMLLK